MMKEKIKSILDNQPGLKGRQIARKLDIDRKTINSFLSKNEELFEQDQNYCWFNKNSGVFIELPSGWIDASKYESALSNYGDLFTGYDHITFVFSENCNLLLESISRFLALLNQLALHNIGITIDVAECVKTRAFLNRAGFFDLLSLDVKVLPKRPKSSTAKVYKGNNVSLVEFGSICPKSKNKELIISLCSSFIDKSSEVYETVALTVFSEFIGNVSEHSESVLDGFAALQIYQPKFKSHHIQTVISDSGLGVVSTLRRTLKEYYPALYDRFPDNGIESDIGLILEVFSNGNISRYGRESGRGLGFKSTREQASKFDADLSIRLDTFNIKLQYREGVLVQPTVTKDLTRMMGTHICFDFIVD